MEEAKDDRGFYASFSSERRPLGRDLEALCRQGTEHPRQRPEDAPPIRNGSMGSWIITWMSPIVGARRRDARFRRCQKLGGRASASPGI